MHTCGVTFRGGGVTIRAISGSARRPYAVFAELHSACINTNHVGVLQIHLAFMAFTKHNTYYTNIMKRRLHTLSITIPTRQVSMDMAGCSPSPLQLGTPQQPLDDTLLYDDTPSVAGYQAEVEDTPAANGISGGADLCAAAQLFAMSEMEDGEIDEEEEGEDEEDIADAPFTLGVLFDMMMRRTSSAFQRLECFHLVSDFIQAALDRRAVAEPPYWLMSASMIDAMDDRSAVHAYLDTMQLKIQKMGLPEWHDRSTLIELGFQVGNLWYHYARINGDDQPTIHV